MDAKTTLVIFLIYTFFGAIAEHISYFIEGGKKKSLSNPIITGFPIYGLGALIVIWLRRLVILYNIPLIVEFFIYGFALESLELASGLIVKAGSRSYEICDHGEECISSWDYSQSKWNIYGIIDLRHFFLFSISGMIVSRITPYIEEYVQRAFNPEC